MKKEDIRKVMLQKKEWRIKKIEELVKIFSSGKGDTKPDKKEVEEYRKILVGMKPRYLESIHKVYETTLVDDSMKDKIKKLDKRFQSQIIIFMDNQTLDTFTINDKGRTFERKGMTYIINQKAGIQWFHNRREVFTYFYYQNNPHAIIFRKNKVPEGTPDATLLKRVLHFEFLQALANAVRMNKKVDIVLIAVALIFILNVVMIGLMLKGFGMVGG